MVMIKIAHLEHPEGSNRKACNGELLDIEDYSTYPVPATKNAIKQCRACLLAANRVAVKEREQKKSAFNRAP